MKRILVIITTIIAALCMAGCIESESLRLLKRSVEKTDRECPQNMGMSGDLLSVDYNDKDKTVEMYFAVNDNIINIDAMNENEDLFLRTTKLSFAKGKSVDLIKQMIKAGSGLSMTYKSNATGKTFTMTLNLDDLKSIVNTPMAESEINQLLLDNIIAIENQGCPKKGNDGIDMIKMYDDGTNVIAVYRMDENRYDIEALKSVEGEVRDNLKDVFKDPTSKRQLGVMHSLGRGLVFRYTGDKSNRSFDIVFKPNELKLYVE